MCNFDMVAGRDDGCGIQIWAGHSGPHTLTCWSCSLSETGENFKVDGVNFDGMVRHVQEHIKAGEKISPMVIRLLKEKSYNTHINNELAIVSDLYHAARKKLGEV